MNLKDRILAQKTFEANKYKFEAKNGGSSRVYTPAVINRRLRSRQGSQAGSGSSKGEFGGRRPSTEQGSRSRGSRGGNSHSGSGQTMSLARLEELEALPKLGSPASSSRPSSQQQPRAKKNAHDMTPEELIEELSQRGMTQSLALQKQQLAVAEGMRKKTGKVDYSDPDFDYEAMMKEDYYMPKVTLTRPDGATLMDIYRSKQADTWSLILRSQLAQEEEQKKEKKLEHVRSNETYGRLLKEQLARNAARGNADDVENERLAAIVESTSKAKDDEQRQRKTDAVNRQKKFIQHALEDIETKRVSREIELSNELEAAMKTNNKVKAAIAQDELKKAKLKEKESARLAALWEENQKELARKAEIKRLDGEENLRVFKEGERRMKIQEDARQADLAKKLKASGDGPAHSLTWEATRRFRENTDKFFAENERRPNMLNKQLMKSEADLDSRNKNKGNGLLESWDKSVDFKRKAADAEKERLKSILEYQKKQTAKALREDEEKREAKRQSKMTYQRELDVQLGISRQRSQDALRKTMSSREQLYNSGLLLQTGLISSVDELTDTGSAIAA